MTPARPPLTRDAILAEARALVVEGGIATLSLRRLGSRLGVTAPAVYLHFASKDDLMRALAEDEFARLIVRLEEAASTSSRPLAQIKAQSRAYIEHALESPTLFEVLFMFRPGWTPEPGVEDFPLASKAWAVSAAAVEDALTAGLLHARDPLVAALTIWSAVHGIATLLAAGPRLGAAYEDALVDSVIDTVLAGLAAPRHRQRRPRKGGG